MQPVATLPIVYVLDPSVAVTGAFVAARNMARALKDSARVVLVLPQQTHITRAQCADFWRVEHVPYAALSKQPASMLAYMPRLLRSALRLRRLMRGDQCAHLILNDFYLMQGGLLRLLGYRGKIISFVRGDPARFAGALAPIMLHWQRMTANRIIAVSQHVRRLLPHTLATTVLYDYFSGTSRAPKAWAAADEKIFLAIGNYIPGKGQDLALEAFAQCAPQDATIRLHFCGGDMGLQKNCEYRQALEARAAILGLAERVQFHPFMADTSELLASAFAAVNFSESESFSMTVLEASGHGLPVIATRSGGPQEILIEGKTGFLIPVGDVAAAANAVRKLAADPAQAQAMGQAGAAHVAQHFTRDNFAKSLSGMLGLMPEHR